LTRSLKVSAFCHYLKIFFQGFNRSTSFYFFCLEALDWWASLKKHDMWLWSEQNDEMFVQNHGSNPMC